MHRPLFCIGFLVLALSSRGQCPVTSIDAVLTISGGGTAIPAGGAAGSIAVSFPFASTSSFFMELNTINYCWTVSVASGGCSGVSIVNTPMTSSAGNFVLSVPSGCSGFNLSITPNCSQINSSFNVATNGSYYLTQFNIYSAYTNPGTNTPNASCPSLFNQHPFVFTLGLPHLSYIVSDGIPGSSPVHSVFINGTLGTLAAIQGRYYMRQVVVTNDGTSPYDFSTTLNITNTNAGASSLEYQVTDIYSESEITTLNTACNGHFYNGYPTDPTTISPGEGLSVTTGTLHYSYSLSGTTLAHMHYDNSYVATSTPLGALVPGQSFIFYELIKVLSCNNNATGFYESDMTFNWDFTACGSTINYSSTQSCTPGGGNAACTAMFYRQQNDPNLNLSASFTPVPSTTSPYCWGSTQTLEGTATYQNIQINSVADGISIDLYRSNVTGGTELYFTDIQSIESIDWFDQSSSSTPVAH